MADVNNNDAIMKRFLYQEKISFEEYGKIKVDTRTNIFAKSYAESLKNTFKGLSDAKIRMFRGGLNKKVLDKSEEIKAECEKLVKEDKGLEALGLMYGALKYDSADQEFKDMVDKVEKKDKPAEPEKPKAKETRKERRARRAKEMPEGQETKTTKEEKPLKADEKKGTPAPDAPAEDKEAKTARLAPSKKDVKKSGYPHPDLPVKTKAEKGKILIGNYVELNEIEEFNHIKSSYNPNDAGSINSKGYHIEPNTKNLKSQKIDIPGSKDYMEIYMQRKIENYDEAKKEYLVTYTIEEQRFNFGPILFGLARDHKGQGIVTKSKTFIVNESSQAFTEVK